MRFGVGAIVPAGRGHLEGQRDFEHAQVFIRLPSVALVVVVAPVVVVDIVELGFVDGTVDVIDSVNLQDE